MPERVVFVHAHPDDESISTGGSIATLIDRGAVVTVVTCTRGELGEIMRTDLRRAIVTPIALGLQRERELARALSILGVVDHRYLGSTTARAKGKEPRQYLDSGMRWGRTGALPLAELDPECLVAAPLEQVVADIAEVVTDVRPDVIISYDQNGGYGHPDHIRAHDATVLVAHRAGIPYFSIAAQPTGRIDLAIEVSPVIERKRKAIAAHRTQVRIVGDEYEMSNGVRTAITTTEAYRLVPRHRFSGRPRLRRVVRSSSAIIGSLILGIAVGLVMTGIHQAKVGITQLNLPLGTAVALISAAAVLAGLRVIGNRIVTASAAIGLLGVIAVLELRSSGGVELIPTNGAGYVWTYGAALIAVAAVVWPREPSTAPGKIDDNPTVKGSSHK
jgi:N-acetyl-1-D-myo-inositol-2-amino-2-deoxy-alpha-D-glucopyranoside deacetylase